jgi:hypothetical protein
MTKKQISILVAEDILGDIDGLAESLGRSRNWVIDSWLRYSQATMNIKKIADVSVGVGAQSSGGTPDLSPVGKAQDGANSLLTPRFPKLDKAIADYERQLDGEAVGVDEPFLYGRSGVAPDFNEVIIPRQQFPDGVPCGHAGCLSHVSHPCDSCGRIGGRRPIYNMEDNEAAKKNRGESVPLDMRFSEKWLREMAAFETGGLMACSPEILGRMKEEAKTNSGVAATLHRAGVELDREILVRWGLAENYKPKTFARPLVDKNKLESIDGGENTVGRKANSKKGTAAGEDRRNPAPDAEGNDGGQSGAVATGKPKVDMKALRDICAGNTPRNAQEAIAEVMEYDRPDPYEVDLCGFKSYNEIDGENYVCGKEVHGPKVKHGDWIQI